jgi:hypothetical protein
MAAVELDLSNAFHSISRSSVASILHRDSLPIFAALYLHPTPLHFHRHTILMRNGIPQGCNTGPCLLATVIEPIFTAFTLHYPDCSITAYADDIAIIGPHHLIDNATSHLTAQLSSAGFSLAQKPFIPHLTRATSKIATLTTAASTLAQKPLPLHFLTWIFANLLDRTLYHTIIMHFHNNTNTTLHLQENLIAAFLTPLFGIPPSFPAAALAAIGLPFPSPRLPYVIGRLSPALRDTLLAATPSSLHPAVSDLLDYTPPSPPLHPSP